MGGSARLIHSAIASVDGYVADDQGKFDWAAPDAEVHEFINALERPVGTYLYGRRMYETMAGWETDPHPRRPPEPMRDFAEIWRAAEKVVYTKTLETPSTRRTRIEREFDPEAVRHESLGGRDLTVGGPDLAGQAFRAGLVDECHLFVAPIVVEAASGHCQSRCGWSSSRPHVGSTEGWSICTTGEGSAAGFESTSWCYLSPLPEDAVASGPRERLQHEDLDREVRIDVVVTHEADHRAPRQRFDLTGHLDLATFCQRLRRSSTASSSPASARVCSPRVRVSCRTTKTALEPSVVLALGALPVARRARARSHSRSRP